MISPRYPTPARGVALVVVLAVVVLLTGLVLAFFSRALSERQISDSSANQTRVDLFTQGAVDAVISNLQREVVLTSTPKPITTGNTTTTLYFPNDPSGVMPQRSTPPTGITKWAPNVLIRSAANQNFYTGTGSVASIPGNAIPVSATTPSQNARTVSLERWNAHYLLPLANASSGITADNGPLPDSTTFAPPDWVLVARDGSNPVQSGTSSPLDLTWSKTNASTVVGRYAYVIYHEGGLLDINVAGYPVGSGTSSVTPNASYKRGLPFADLTRVGFTQAQSDQLVAWRNFGSIQPPGQSYLTPNYTPASGMNYLNLVLAAKNGFLTVPGTALYQNQTDRMFASRTDLIDFVKTGLSMSGSTLNALNYLTTFSRGLDQPSFNPNLYNTGPKVVAQASGGNDAYGKDGDINPALLAVRVTTAFTRIDGTQAKVGDPLINKRFPLQRLAWITYQGPSKNRATTSDADIAALVSNGITRDFLQQGDDQTIKKYFGLTWNGSNNWTYTGQGQGGAIAKLSEVAAQNRDPDFIELLQAAIHTGAIAKAATSGTNSRYANVSQPGQPYPNSQQYNLDTATNDAIIQIAANIIEQSKTDGYPVSITFAGSKFYGSENLPYFCGIQPGVLKLREASPPSTSGSLFSTVPNTPPNDLKDTGVALWMQIPSVWNPYDQNCSRGVGSLYPTKFRLFATQSGNYPAELGTPPDQTVPVVNTLATYVNDYTLDRNESTLNGAPAKFTTGAGGAGIGLPQMYTRAQFGQSNTMLGFSVPSANAGLFREPTLLVQSGTPNGSGLAFGDNVSTSAASVLSDPSLTPLTQIQDSTGRTSWNGIGFLKETTAKDPLGRADASANAAPFVGIVSGIYPVRWVPTGGTNGTNNQIVNAWGPALWNLLPGSNNGDFTLLVVLQYQDASGNWINYDTKLAPMNLDNISTPLGTEPGMVQQGACNSYTFDPRTARFGMPSSNSNTDSAPGTNAAGPPNTQQWVDPANGVTTTCRPDVRSGYGANIRTPQSVSHNTWGIRSNLTPVGWHVGGYAPTNNPDEIWLKPGLFAQNNPAVMDDGLRYSGDDGSSTPTPDGQFYSDADGVVRRATAAYVQGTSASADTLTGDPLATAVSHGNQSQSRPWMLHRPFQSVAELGYVFSGTPWKNLDMSTPESGYASLLDLFTVQNTNDPNGMVAGRVNLNTQQPQVIQAILNGAYKDEAAAASSTLSTEVVAAAQALVTRTSGDPTAGNGPLCNLSELVGRWNSKVTLSGSFNPVLDPNHNVDGSKSYVGFSDDLTNVMTSDTDRNVPRFRDAAIRALASSGDTRVWNLLIDVVAQTGRYTNSGGNASNPLAGFIVEGEQHRWVHVAIDRLTGQVIDTQVEIVQQ